MSALKVVTMPAPSSALWTAGVTAGTFMMTLQGPRRLEVAGQHWLVEQIFLRIKVQLLNMYMEWIKG